MSHHIVHVFRHGAYLRKQRGMLVCQYPDEDEVHEIAIEDVKAVVIAARGVSITLDATAALLGANAIILHCDDSYKPAGITSGLERTIHPDIIRNQANSSLKFHGRLWTKIINAKTANQVRVLELCKLNAMYLKKSIKRKDVDEAACARYYWMHFFSLFRDSSLRRRKEDRGNVNARLDYGYAVLGALIHRSIIIHGLSPLFGMHHVARYKTHPFVYDLMEPWRPFVDFMLVSFELDKNREGKSMNDWARHIAAGLRDMKVKTPRLRLKAVDAIDVFTSAIAKCYGNKSVRYAWMPEFPNYEMEQLQNGLDTHNVRPTGDNKRGKEGCNNFPKIPPR